MSACDYHLFGWRLRCAFSLPELLPWHGEARDPDIIIERGAVPAALPGGRPFSPAVQIGAGERVRVSIPAVASYLIEGGTRVTVDPVMPIDAPDIRVFLLGTALSVLCFRRGLLPLHASAVEISGKALLLAGDSGTGKSTLAAVLTARGCRLLADDACAVGFASTGQPLIYPAFPRLKLWADAVQNLSVATDGLERSRVQLQKFHLPMDDKSFRSMPLSPAHLILLRDTVLPGPPRIRRLYGLEAMRQRQIIRRWQLGEALGYGPAMFSALARLLAVTPLTELTRHKDLAGIQELADQVMALPEAA